MGKFKVKNGLQVEGLVESSGTGTVITVDTASGEFSYTSSAALGGGGADGNGIYDGSGNVPAGTAVSLTNNFQALQFVSGSNSRLVFNESISALTVNNSNANYDFSISGQTDTALFKTDASNNTIGIGSLGSSNTKLYVAGGTTHPYGMQVQSGGNSTFGYGIFARTTNVSGSAEGGRFESATVTSHTGAQHVGVRGWADYGNSFTCGIQGSAGGSGITYSNTIMGVSAYIGPTDNTPSNNSSYAFHGRNRRTKGNIKYGMYTTLDGTMATASATTYAAYYNNGTSSPSGSAHGLYVASNSTSLNNYGIRVAATNGTNNYALVADNGHVILNESGGDWDFRVEGDTDTNLLFADASADSVGIGTNTPGAKLDVRGSVVFNEDGADADFRVEGDTETHLIFADASADNVGIGTNIPQGRLHVRVDNEGDSALVIDGLNGSSAFGTYLSRTTQADVVTSGTGTATAASITLATASEMVIEGRVIARATGNVAIGGRFTAVAQNIAGTVSIVGVDNGTIFENSVGSPSFNVTAGVGAVNIQVTGGGEASTEWLITYTYEITNGVVG